MEMKSIECLLPGRAHSKAWVSGARVWSRSDSHRVVSPVSVHTVCVPSLPCCFPAPRPRCSLFLPLGLSQETGHHTAGNNSGRNFNLNPLFSFFAHQKRPFYSNATSASSLLFRTRALMKCPFSNAIARCHTWRWQEGQTEPRGYCLSNLIGSRERVSAWLAFRGGSFYRRKKNKLQFPVRTKNRKGWGTWAKTHVSNIANPKLGAPVDCSSFLLLWVLLAYVKRTPIIPGYSYKEGRRWAETHRIMSLKMNCQGHKVTNQTAVSVCPDPNRITLELIKYITHSSSPHLFNKRPLLLLLSSVIIPDIFLRVFTWISW